MSDSTITMKNRANQAVNACIAIHQNESDIESVKVASYIGGEVLKLLASNENTDELSGSEALFGFMGWLTSRKDEVTFSSAHDAGTAVELIKEFCRFNELKDPCENWACKLKHPK